MTPMLRRHALPLGLALLFSCSSEKAVRTDGGGAADGAAPLADQRLDQFFFSTFYGGSGDQWAPDHDVYAYFDDFVFVRP